jgi:hypothetical protein
VTEPRLRRKRIQKEDKIKRWKRTIALTEEYKKVYDAYALKKRTELKERKASKVSAPVDTKTVPTTKPVETKKAPVVAKTVAKTETKVVTKAPQVAKTAKVAKK